MSKKWITVLVTALTVLLLTGCNANQKAVTEAADGFLTALTNNDREAAAQFASGEFMESDTMLFMEPQHLSDAFYAYMGVDKEDLSEEAVKAVDEYVNELVTRAYQSYEIQDVKVQKDTASVTARITLGYDPNASSAISEAFPSGPPSPSAYPSPSPGAAAPSSRLASSRPVSSAISTTGDCEGSSLRPVCCDAAFLSRVIAGSIRT